MRRPRPNKWDKIRWSPRLSTKSTAPSLPERNFGTAGWSTFRAAPLRASFCGAVSGDVTMVDTGYTSGSPTLTHHNQRPADRRAARSWLIRLIGLATWAALLALALAFLLQQRDRGSPQKADRKE